jgi:hypothetical protein
MVDVARPSSSKRSDRLQQQLAAEVQPPQPQTCDPELVDQLKKLVDLRDSGALREEEFRY